MELLDSLRQTPSQDDTISGHYEVRRLLGEGGFGHVFEAWDAKLCRSVALKRLKPQADVLHPEKLINEARLAASLRHAAFVRIFAIEGQGTSQSIVMELVEGQTLGQFMHSGKADLQAALDIAYQIADAMDEAHAMDLVHGDLKPSNLMLEASGKVRILDFGLARHIDPQATQTTTLCDLQGTIAYMAPERLMGRLPDTRGDVYALGAMLYEMLAGQRHFAHLNGLALAAAHMQATEAWPDLPETVPPTINALVRAMTAHDPAERPRTMRDVREAIGVQRGEPLTLATPLADETPAKEEPPASVSIRLPLPASAPCSGARAWRCWRYWRDGSCPISFLPSNRSSRAKKHRHRIRKWLAWQRGWRRCGCLIAIRARRRPSSTLVRCSSIIRRARPPPPAYHSPLVCVILVMAGTIPGYNAQMQAHSKRWLQTANLHYHTLRELGS
ncbi:hypothetical protein CNX70_22665 [Janthinobacterium svalbardensis]|uniref:Protein kinase domain-containing protein n=1 Tax=Janthinobacterium svalbardensis TaxID=368607 RepID=A0A290X0G7_9BURK|nr:serine/threonine-protein kinase [Janthinobacterium svalbardensis]ATD62627.1 hypothetical protein CNX70_22665 [Janthinobacterium svalbardensis]